MSDLLKDKVCVITGAGKGFGKTLAGVFLQHGAKLALITRSQDDVDQLMKELHPSSSSCPLHQSVVRLCCAPGHCNLLATIEICPRAVAVRKLSQLLSLRVEIPSQI